MEENIDIKKLLGKRIKELRVKRGLTQEQLSEMVGIGERNLSKIECGNNFVTAETLSKLLISLNVEPYELFNFEHLKEPEVMKTEIINAINEDKIDVKVLYKFYKSLL